MLMIDLDPVSEQQCFLREITLDFGAQRPFPCAAQHHVKNGGRRRDDNQKNGQQFEEDAVLQVSSTVLGISSDNYELSSRTKRRTYVLPGAMDDVCRGTCLLIRGKTLLRRLKPVSRP